MKKITSLPYGKKIVKKKSRYQKGKILKEIYKRVREREDCRCTICGKYYGYLPYEDIVRLLDVNHVTGRTGQLLYNPRYMTPNCSNLTKEKCHNEKFHKRTKYWRPILLKKLKDKYDSMSEEERKIYS